MYHIIFENLKECEYQGLNPETKDCHLLNGTRYDMSSTEFVTMMAHPDKCEKDFDAVVNYFTQYIDKQGSTPNVKVASIAQARPSKRKKPFLPITLKERSN